MGGMACRRGLGLGIIAGETAALKRHRKIGRKETRSFANPWTCTGFLGLRVMSWTVALIWRKPKESDSVQTVTEGS